MKPFKTIIHVIILTTLRAHQPEGRFGFTRIRTRKLIVSLISLAAIMLGRLRMSIKNCLSEFLGILASMFDAPRTTSMTTPLYWRQAKYDHQAFEEKFKTLVKLHDSKFQERFIDGSFGSDPFQVKT